MRDGIFRGFFMITVTDLSFHFGGQLLFKDVDLKFTPGNCYGIIGANGAGKTTFLKLICGDLEPSHGSVSIPKEERISVLKQDHYAFESFTVLDTVIMGNPQLYAVGKEKDALYEKEDFSDEDGVRASELEAEYAELGGWEAESEASRLIQGLGLPVSLLDSSMSELTEEQKVKVLLAQALFGNPAIILLDEPTNGLDLDAIAWLEDFLSDYPGTVLVVSHDRHFLNDVCTNIVDIDYTHIKMYVGNYEFWYESSQMVQRMIKQQNKRTEEKIRELQEFISRFSANKSKARQATSRRNLLEKLSVYDMPASSRRYPFIGFDMEREPGKDVLSVRNLSARSSDGTELFRDLSFTLDRGDKVAFVGDDRSITALMKILMEEEPCESGSFKWGVSITRSYFPRDNSAYFEGNEDSILDWMRQYSQDQTESYLRGFLGRMLFSGDSVFKQVRVLSGGEKQRCMFSRMMLFGSNMLLLDQPTNHLDLEAITAVNNALKDFKGMVMVSSHDYEIVSTCANRIIEVRPDRWQDYKGTYEEFVENQKAKGITHILL